MPQRSVSIDDDIYQHLQTNAVPLEDDVNSVLRRLLGLGVDAAHPATTQAVVRLRALPRETRRKGKRIIRRTRAAKGTILTEAAYQLPILVALSELGGRAPSSDVIDRVGKILKAQLTDVDRKKLATGEIRWRNRTQFVRLGLVKAGDMKGDSPRGTWEITERGRQRAVAAS